MFRLFFKRSVGQCPDCGAGFYVEAGMFADDRSYRCETCGAMIYVEMRFGSIKSVSLMTHVSEANKGYGGKNDSTSIQSTDKTRYTWNVKWWKEHYGDNWLQAHDEWERRDNEWHERMKNRK